MTDIHIDSAPTPTYHHDANGNRTAWATPTETCGSGGATPCTETDAQDRLVRYDTTTFTYDDHGTLTSKTDGADVTTYDYDELGNLRGVVLPDGTEIDYLIDGRGRRVGRLVDGVVDAYWVYQDALNPVAQLDASGNVEQLYVYANLPHVPALIVEPGGRTLRVVTDQVGSVRRIVDTADGTIVQSIDYSPFGVIEAESATGGFNQPFRFAGGLWDADTELARFGARDYDPRVGRWTAKDPALWGGGGTNFYEWSRSGPVNYLDTNGRVWWLGVWALALALSTGSDNAEHNGRPGGHPDRFIGTLLSEVAWAGGVKALSYACKGRHAGTARVFNYGNQHMSIEVRHGDDVMHTHQQIVDEQLGTEIVPWTSRRPPTEEAMIPLPDARSALQYQRAVVGKPTGPYHLQSNSCVTHCGDVLRAGGVKGVPGTTGDIHTWLRGIFMRR